MALPAQGPQKPSTSSSLHVYVASAPKAQMDPPGFSHGQQSYQGLSPVQPISPELVPTLCHRQSCYVGRPVSEPAGRSLWSRLQLHSAREPL